MKVMQRILCLFLAMPFMVSAEVYKWKDENGKIHFTDKKPEGEEKLEVARDLEGKYSDNSPDLSFSVVHDPKFINVKDITRILSWEPRNEIFGATTVAVKYQYDGYQGVDGIYIGVVESKNGWPSPESAYEPQKVKVGINTAVIRFYWKPERKDQMCPENIIITIYGKKGKTISESPVKYGECLTKLNSNNGYEILRGVE